MSTIVGFDVNKECKPRSYKKEFLLETCKTLKLDCDKKQLNVDLCNKIKSHLSSKEPVVSVQQVPISDDTTTTTTTIITVEGKSYDFADYEKDTFLSSISLKTLKEIAARLSIKKKTFKTKKEWVEAIHKNLVKQTSPPPVKQRFEKLQDANVRIGKKIYDFRKYEDDVFYTGITKQTLQKLSNHFKITISKSKPKKKDYGKAIHDHLVGDTAILPKEPSVKAVVVQEEKNVKVQGTKVKKDGKVYDFTKRDKTTFYNPVKKQIFIAIAGDVGILPGVINNTKKKKDLVELIYNKLTQKKAPSIAPSAVTNKPVIVPPSSSTTTDRMSVQEIREAIKKCLAL